MNTSKVRHAEVQPAPGTAALDEATSEVFNAMTDVPVLELQHHQLEEFFQARAAAFDISARTSCATDVTSLIAALLQVRCAHDSTVLHTLN